VSALSLLLPIAWRNLWRNPRRTLITLVVVAVGVWSILAFDVLLKAFAASSREASLRLLTGEGQIHAAGYLDDPSVTRRMPSPQGALKAALDGPAVAGWAPRVRVPAVIQSEYRTRAITFLGVSPGAERKVSDLPRQIAAGRYLAGDGDAGLVIGRDLAAKLKTRLGKRVIVLAQGADGRLTETGYVIVGLFDIQQAAEDEFVFTGVAHAQTRLGVGTGLSEIAFDAGSKTPLADVVGRLRRAAPGLEVRPWMELSPLVYAIETFSQAYTQIWLLIMFVLMAIGIVNTQLMAVFERTREFGLLQALGMRPRQIVLLVSLEAAFLIGLGVLAGAGLMVATVAPFAGRGVDLSGLAAGIEMVGAGSTIYPKIEPAAAAQFCLIVWVLGVLAALWPARTAAKAAPVTAMAQL
jgi:ABC-type lipoprotein release transport system permease subunit